MKVMEYQIQDSVLRIAFEGDYIKKNLPEDFFNLIKSAEFQKIYVDATHLKSWDSSLLIVLFELSRFCSRSHILFESKDLPKGVEKLLKLATAVEPVQNVSQNLHEGFLDHLGGWGINIYRSFLRGFHFALKNLKVYFSSFFQKPLMRHVDFLFALQECGPSALPIVSLISFMVGLILAFVGAIQLQTFGAQIYVASLVTIGMTRIMGAIMVGIIMAGRTGASFAASLGTMQVNEEIDALKTMGVDINEFLVLPKMTAIVIAMPLLTMWADFAGILGGAFVGILALDIPTSEFLRFTINAWSLKHFTVGLFHGLTFGFIIALCGCYFGVHCGKDADSVGHSTTQAVVYSIVWMIVATGVITFVLQRIGI